MPPPDLALVWDCECPGGTTFHAAACDRKTDSLIVVADQLEPPGQFCLRCLFGCTIDLIADQLPRRGPSRRLRAWRIRRRILRDA